MQVSHKNRVPCTTLQCSYNAARTSWLSGGYRLGQWVGQSSGQVNRVDHSWPALSRAEPKGLAKVELIDQVGHKLPRIDRFARLDRFRGLFMVAYLYVPINLVSCGLLSLKIIVRVCIHRHVSPYFCVLRK